MSNHAKLLLPIFCLTAGLWGQSPAVAVSHDNDGKAAAHETSLAPQTKSVDAGGQGSGVLPDSTRLEAIFTPNPIYPREASAQGLQGQVVIQLEISEAGDVTSATAVSGEPALAAAAIDAMKKWKFKPFIKDGKAVPVRVKIPHNFAFQGNVSQIKTPLSQPAQQSPGASTASDGPATDAAAIAIQRPGKLRLSQEVMDGQKIYDVRPVYPPAARQIHLQGEVLLRATIGKDGLIHNLQAISGPPALVVAAIGAVQQWRYRPYLLMGNPVEVETTVRVQFHMGR
jgi:TonB family protein